MLFRRRPDERAGRHDPCDHDGVAARCFACCVAIGFGVLVPPDAEMDAGPELAGSVAI